MSLQNFIFKRIDQLIIFMVITLFFIFIMYFKKNADEIEIAEYINTAFIDICDVKGLPAKGTMGGFHNMYCNSVVDESLFAELVLTYKLLYTSSYNYNINLIDSMSSILNNKKNNSVSTHKILLILLYIVVYFLFELIVRINTIFTKIFQIKKTNKPKRKAKEALGPSIAKSFKNRFFAFIFFIITTSILLNVFTYIGDIFMGMAQPSKLRGIFFVQIIILAFVLLFTGIFNIKPPATTNNNKNKNKNKNNKNKKTPEVLTTCKNNNKYLILIFFLIIPIITGLKQFTTIVSRGISGMISSKENPQIKILFNTAFIMILILFNIEILTQLGKKKSNSIIK